MECTEKMAEENLTIVVEFVLLGFSDYPKLQGFLFVMFLVIYLSILIGNGLIIIITKVDSALQTPMYFFLGNFSFLEICYTSVTLPRMLVNIWTQKRNISFLACAIQLGFLLILGAPECLLLGVMAYDRYVAICKPLYYPLIMNHKVCVQLVVGSWTIGIPVQIAQTYQVFSLPFYGSNKLNHIFCDLRPVLKVAHGNTFVSELSIYAVAMLFGMAPFLMILWSYMKIVSTIQKIPSTTGKYKTFSTCSSHIMVVGLFFGSIIITYLQPKSSHSADNDKIFSLFYTILTPMFNPLIYTLRNRDVIIALKKLFKCEQIDYNVGKW
ncbi:olfactory receptor 10AG1-like [Monodelphis domestica]|uniref:olfactory receptor 10AG1-like n=1 Tax=Monodelphis domestica TaxID=13616 RepID=UPI0024E1EB19|nr:olfactory receptor 10AG1-like [Monodelphis domestica]